jgi:hypothetical protein
VINTTGKRLNLFGNIYLGKHNNYEPCKKDIAVALKAYRYSLSVQFIFFVLSTPFPHALFQNFTRFFFFVERIWRNATTSAPALPTGPPTRRVSGAQRVRGRGRPRHLSPSPTWRRVDNLVQGRQPTGTG